MAIIKSLFLEISSVSGFGASMGAQLLIIETRYNQETTELELGAVMQNVVIPRNRLASVLVATNNGATNHEIHIKNGNVTVLKISTDTYNPNGAANYSSSDLSSFHSQLIAIHQN